jgi:hypothetical protein
MLVFFLAVTICMGANMINFNNFDIFLYLFALMNKYQLKAIAKEPDPVKSFIIT